MRKKEKEARSNLICHNRGSEPLSGLDQHVSLTYVAPSCSHQPFTRQCKTQLQRWSAKSVGRFFTGIQEQRLAILCYHSIHPTHSFALHPGIFEAHLAWLTEHCQVLPFDQVLSHTEEQPAKPKVALTFDDGYRDNHEIVLPLLLKYGLTATFFITTGFIDGNASVIDRLRAEWRATQGEVSPMSWQQVRELRGAGMPIGAHTCTHRSLKSLDAAAVCMELTESKKILEDQCGVNISSLAYPYGEFGSSVGHQAVQIAAEAGYQRAALVQFRGVRPSDSLLQLPRFVADIDSTETLRQKVLGWWDIMSIGSLLI